VVDCGVQSDGPRQRAATAAAPISALLQSIKPQARAVEVVPSPPPPAKEVERASAQHMDLKPHQVTMVVMMMMMMMMMMTMMMATTTIPTFRDPCPFRCSCPAPTTNAPNY
jgi:hypothetical protein